MASATVPILFRNAEPIPGNNPVFSRANFSVYPQQQYIQVSVSDIPRIYVASEFGSNMSQKDLAEAYRSGTDNKSDLILYVDPVGRGSANALSFQEKYDSKVTEYINASVHTSSKGKKRGPGLDMASVYTPEGYIKMKVAPDVWKKFKETVPEDRRGDILTYPRGDVVYLVFSFTGIWHNAAQYGHTIRVRRIDWRRAGTYTPPVPKSIEFAEDDEDVPAAEVEMASMSSASAFL